MRWNRAVVVLWSVSALALLAQLGGAASSAYTTRVVCARALGFHALLGLSASLCVTPLQRLLGTMGRSLRGTAQLRRALGLASVASGALHAGVGVWSSPLRLREQLDDAQLRLGVGAIAVLCLLGATSFPSVVQWSKLRSWKELHRLAYVAWSLALLHGLLATYAWTLGLLGIAAIVGVFGVLRALPVRKTPER